MPVPKLLLLTTIDYMVLAHDDSVAINLTNNYSETFIQDPPFSTLLYYETTFSVSHGSHLIILKPSIEYTLALRDHLFCLS